MDSAAHVKVLDGLTAIKATQKAVSDAYTQLDGDRNKILEEMTQVTGATPDDAMLQLVNQDKTLIDQCKSLLDAINAGISTQEDLLKQHAKSKIDDAALLGNFTNLTSATEKATSDLPQLLQQHTALQSQLTQLIATKKATMPVEVEGN